MRPKSETVVKFFIAKTDYCSILTFIMATSGITTTVAVVVSSELRRLDAMPRPTYSRQLACDEVM